MGHLRDVAHSRAKIRLLVSLSIIPVDAFAGAINSAATAWTLTATGLLLFLTVPGLALFYGGLVRTRNALSAIFPCFAIAALISIVWIILGYSLAFTSAEGLSPVIGGLSRLFLRGLSIENASHGVPESVFAMYQLAFAIFAPTLMVGSLVERIKLPALLLFASLWSLLVYIPVVHWIWGRLAAENGGSRLFRRHRHPYCIRGRSLNRRMAAGPSPRISEQSHATAQFNALRHWHRHDLGGLARLCTGT